MSWFVFDRKLQRSTSRGTWTLAVVLSALGACGGETTEDAAGSGGSAADLGTGGHAPGTGGAAQGSGGSSATGGSTTGGGTAGGSDSGGSSTTGGGTAGGPDSGGSPGTGGLPAICDCDAADIPVCGVDGQSYSAGCGLSCVPVEIACTGSCPCGPPEDCDCQLDSGDWCGDHHLSWLCAGSDHDPVPAYEQGCEGLPTGLERYCCPPSVTTDAFCSD